MKKFFGYMIFTMGLILLAGCCGGKKENSKCVKKSHQKKDHAKKGHKNMDKTSESKNLIGDNLDFEKMCNECGNLLGECTCNL